jgi:ureidoacrylate peracid hydrolase
LDKERRDILIITGVGTNVCCESTARDAMMLNYKVIFVSDANATVNKIFHEISLMNIKMFFGDVVTTEEIISDLMQYE